MKTDHDWDRPFGAVVVWDLVLGWSVPTKGCRWGPSGRTETGRGGVRFGVAGARAEQD